MNRIRLHTPDGVYGDGLELQAGQAIVIGRSPDAEAARDAVEEASTVDCLRVPSPSVSASHVLVEATRDRLMVTDLASRHGTWVRATGRRRVEVGAGDVDVRVGELTTSSDGEEDDLPAIRWTDANDFAHAVAVVANDWLARTTDAAEVAIVDDAESTPLAPGTVRIPLPGDEALDIRIHRTVDTDWPRKLARLWKHVAAYVAVFDAEAGSRADGIILSSDAIRAVHRRVVEAATRGRRLMLLGPSGSGKEMLARAYHRHSNRSGPFVAINCAELDDRVRAELFGTEAGAYTDAIKRAGAVEAANGGTLFLDEVGELSKDVQATLLRFLDRGEFARAGDLAKIRKTDVRIVCATNRDLREQVREDRFRLDLWFRLASDVVEVPPLHDRLDDLVAYLAARRHRGAASTWAALSPSAADLVRGHRWDGRWGGNFRELENFAARLPDAAGPGSIDVGACRRAIEAGAIEPLRTTAKPAPALAAGSWAEVASMAALLAATTFAEDHGAPPEDWNAVKDYIENHLKPVLFAKLAGVAEAATVDAARAEASKLGADRATRARQLERYFERFSPLSED